MKRIAASMLALLMVTACAAGTVTSSTSPTDTSTSITTTSTTTTTPQSTTEAGPTTTGGPPQTLPPEIAQTVFAFAGGLSAIFITVEVADSPDGPWLPAGFFADVTPSLSGPNYWVRFTIENLDELGPVVDVVISGFDNSDLGEDVCDLDLPILIGGSATCVVGGVDGFPVLSGGSQNDYEVTAKSQHQGYAPDRWFQPLVEMPLAFNDARHSFVFLFETGTEEGVRIDGTADGSEIKIDLPGLELSGSVSVDCSDRFPNGFSGTGGSPNEGEPPVAGYVIENFSRAGESRGGCADIPTETLDMDLDGDTSAYLYTSP